MSRLLPLECQRTHSTTTIFVYIMKVARCLSRHSSLSDIHAAAVFQYSCRLWNTILFNSVSISFYSVISYFSMTRMLVLILSLLGSHHHVFQKFGMLDQNFVMGQKLPKKKRSHPFGCTWQLINRRNNRRAQPLLL